MGRDWVACCGWLGGGKLQAADLRPWRLPYSIHNPDPRPLLTLWAGPVFGCLAPVIAAIAIRRPWATFIASACCLANGTYLAAGWLSGDRFLDTTRLLDAGASRLAIAAFCATTFIAGYAGCRAAATKLWTQTQPSRDAPSA